MEEYNVCGFDKSKELEKLHEEDKRVCTECGKEMIEGYCIDNGLEYYCNAECLGKHYTDEEWADLYATGDSYWTSWEE